MTSLALLNISAQEQHAATQPALETESNDEKFLTHRSGARDASLLVCALTHTRLFTHAWGGIKKFGPPGVELVKFLIRTLRLRHTVNLFHASPNFTRWYFSALESRWCLKRDFCASWNYSTCFGCLFSSAAIRQNWQAASECVRRRRQLFLVLRRRWLPPLPEWVNNGSF